MVLLFTSTLVAMLSGLVGAALGRRTGRADAGFIWAFVLGPFGWLFPAAWLLTGRRATA